jgi:hypothetical protein
MMEAVYQRLVEVAESPLLPAASIRDQVRYQK